MNMSVTQEYQNEFERCYPSHKVELKRKGGKEGMSYFVIIDGDKGERAMTLGEMTEAIRMFKRGRV